MKSIFGSVKAKTYKDEKVCGYYRRLCNINDKGKHIIKHTITEIVDGNSREVLINPDTIELDYKLIQQLIHTTNINEFEKRLKRSFIEKIKNLLEGKRE